MIVPARMPARHDCMTLNVPCRCSRKTRIAGGDVWWGSGDEGGVGGVCGGLEVVVLAGLCNTSRKLAVLSWLVILFLLC